MAVSAYASLISLTHVLDHVQHLPRNRLLTISPKQIETLQDQVSCLLEFVEIYSKKSDDIEDLARQIADVAFEAEDIIDFHVVDQGNEYVNSKPFFPDIEKVMGQIDSIKKDLMLFKEECIIQEEQLNTRVAPTSSLSLPVTTKNDKNTMVGFDEHLVRIMDELTGHRSSLQIIPIVGMGGIGKTTLARNIFDNPYVVQHFHILHWCTISQEYNLEETLRVLLNDRESKESGEKLGERLHKSLSGRRYLIVMDDVWSTEAWDDIRMFFPDNKNGSRIVITTRLSNVALSLASHSPYLMDFLDEDKSWVLFSEKAFEHKSCPLELEKTGKKIAKSCRGLPLAIVVIGGLLANSEMTREYWECVARNVSSFVNTENDEHCLKILALSYKHLPIRLKPCLLYMRVFPEDHEVRVSKLTRLWVAEGFLKPMRDKSLEEIANGYLNDLIGRNLILIHKRTRKIRTCGVHDLLRDLCIRESQKEQLFSVPKVQRVDLENSDMCFLCSHKSPQERIHLPGVLLSRSTSHVGLQVCNSCRHIYPQVQLNRLRLLRAVKTLGEKFMQHTKLRYLQVSYIISGTTFEFLSPSIALLWNLQSLHINTLAFNDLRVLPYEIWEMPQLRHLLIENYTVLPDPTQTENARERSSQESQINLKKLRIQYDNVSKAEVDWSYYSLHNLTHLHELESLSLKSERFSLKNITFPYSLKKLCMYMCGIPWEDMTIIGKLPNLEVLRLYMDSFVGPVWNPVEGEFLQLKFLSIDHSDIVCWGAENIHFPNLECLKLKRIEKLDEIPLSIGEIATLHSIHLVGCSESINNSGKAILEEQQSMGNEGLQLHTISLSLLLKDLTIKIMKKEISNVVVMQYPNKPHV